MRTHFRWRVCALVLLVVALPSAGASGQSNAFGQIRRDLGQNVVPVFEGWEKNPDGSFNLVFGYMNRNYQERPEIPVGPENNFSPGPPDRGQPAYFYPRRQQFMFKVRVPADFGKQELVWTLTRNGQTEKAYGHLILEEELSDVVLSENRGGLANDSVSAKPNEPPTISIDGPPQRTASVGVKLTLTASAADDGVPKPPAPGGDRPTSTSDGVPLLTPRDRPTSQAIVKPSRQGLAATWIQWRGPGHSTFDPMTAVVKDGKVTTSVSFSKPGTYVIRAYADDGVLMTPADVTVIVNDSSRGQANR